MKNWNSVHSSTVSESKIRNIKKRNLLLTPTSAQKFSEVQALCLIFMKSKIRRLQNDLKSTFSYFYPKKI